MKRAIFTGWILLILIGCTTPNDNPEDDIMPTICETTQSVVELSSTATLDAATLWRHSTQCDGLQYKDGRIVLSETAQEGTLTTGVFQLPQYTELVPSWNIVIDDDAKVRIRLIPSDDPTDDSLMMGYWTNDYKMSLSNQTSELGTVQIDTFIPTEPAEYVQFIVEFEGGNPSLKTLSITTKPSDVNGIIPDNLHDVSIDVPSKQQLSVPTIGSSICSPTSLAMVLSYYGYDMTPTASAEAVRDQGAGIYGNWSFNASYAGGFDSLLGHVEYIDDMATILQYLDNDVPLVLSIRTTSKDELDGSIMAYPSGHLIVLRGLTQMNDVWYALVNDPAEYTDEAVPRSYPLEQLLAVFRGYAYVIQPISTISSE